MTRVRSKTLHEAEKLLAEVATWSDDEIDTLPRLYQERAREYRRLLKSGQREDTSQS